MSDAALARHASGEPHPMLGKKHSAETIKKQSDAMLGKNNHQYGKHWKLVDGKRIYY